ncbi:MAG TPA: hypothetical protein EYN54_12340 [Methylococcaceae bacterium]|nr:hypothetical protein [Methylococcaceae bacterium]
MTIIYKKEIKNVKVSKAGDILSYGISVRKNANPGLNVPKYSVIGEYLKSNKKSIYNTTYQKFSNVNKALIAAIKIGKRISKIKGSS